MAAQQQFGGVRPGCANCSSGSSRPGLPAAVSTRVSPCPDDPGQPMAFGPGSASPPFPAAGDGRPAQRGLPAIPVIRADGKTAIAKANRRQKQKRKGVIIMAVHGLHVRRLGMPHHAAPAVEDAAVTAVSAGEVAVTALRIGTQCHGDKSEVTRGPR